MLFNIETFTQKRPNRNDLKKFHHVEILGFKFRIATDPNVAETYVYFAMAHNPFKYATAER